ncbi:MAG: hypothetical protein JWN22_1416, partial [Nocardioides sp.]|nr:hypothetical protein [Nocardioides sp.]
MTTPGESQTESESGSGRQVSEVASFRGAGVPISPDDAVAGA